jgi:hypothetical protein
MIELWPRGTCKSYAVQELFPYFALLTGPTTVANLFGRMNGRQKSMLMIWDVVGFDEVADLERCRRKSLLHSRPSVRRRFLSTTSPTGNSLRRDTLRAGLGKAHGFTEVAAFWAEDVKPNSRPTESPHHRRSFLIAPWHQVSASGACSAVVDNLVVAEVT